MTLYDVIIIIYKRSRIFFFSYPYPHPADNDRRQSIGNGLVKIPILPNEDWKIPSRLCGLLSRPYHASSSAAAMRRRWRRRRRSINQAYADAPNTHTHYVRGPTRIYLDDDGLSLVVAAAAVVVSVVASVQCGVRIIYFFIIYRRRRHRIRVSPYSISLCYFISLSLFTRISYSHTLPLTRIIIYNNVHDVFFATIISCTVCEHWLLKMIIP